MDDLCCKCRWFLKPNTSKEGEGFCRRFPPIHKTEVIEPSDIPLDQWPRVLSSHWCGEFKRK